MPILKFYTDFYQDLGHIKYQYVYMRKALGNKDFYNLLKRYYPEFSGKTDEDIYDFFLKNKKEIMRKTVLASIQIKKKWKRIEKEYFNQMEKIMGFKWKQRIYYCHLSSSFICGGGRWFPNKIALFPRMTNFYPIMTICHELFHLHFFEYLQNKGVKITDAKINELWDLSESIDFILLELKIKGMKYKVKNFPQHEKLYKKLKNVWKGDFEEFIKKALKIYKD